METLTLHRKRLAGFSLVEMAIVLLIVGIMMSSGLSLLTVKMNAANVEATQKRQEAIKQALINYLGQKKRLPCPGNINGAELTRSATPPTCQNYSGIVPYQELGLDRSVALDGWENFITYVVSPTPNPTTTPPFNAWLYTYGTTASSQVTTDPSLAFWPSNSSGAINVTGTSAINGVVVALISYGKNGYGASTVKGTNAQPPATNIDEQKNAVSSVAATGVLKRDTTDSIAGGGPFDDIVMILSANDLIGPLVANGTLQSSAQAALNQANDMVIGNILPSRSCTSTPSCSQNSANPVCTNSVQTCTAYDTATPPNCTAYGYVCTAYSTPSPTCTSTSYTNACSYSLPSNSTFTSPPNVAAWGVKYVQVIPTISASTTPSTGTAYTITAADGEQKSVLVGELQGILSRSAGFN